MNKVNIIDLCNWISEKPEEVVIAFMGDVMIGRMVNTKIDHTSYIYPWGELLEILKAVDLRICNLETTLTDSKKEVPKVFNFKANPDKVNTLLAGGIDVVNIANNHIRDFDIEGMRETIRVLNDFNILHVGAGDSNKEALCPVILEVKGLKFGFIGLTDNEPDWAATKNIPGTNYIEVGDVETARKQISSLREKVDIVIVSIHWGPNMVDTPTLAFQNFGKKLIDFGADVVHGHSAHVVQGVEIYKGKLIMYDTGEFIDDYAVHPDMRNDLSFLFLLRLVGAKLSSLALVPVSIQNMQVNLAKGADYDFIVPKMKVISGALGTSLSEISGCLYYDFD